MRDSLRRLVPVLSIVAMVAALVLGASSLRALTDDVVETPSSGALAAQSTADQGDSLDLGPTTSDDVVSCLAPDFAVDPQEVDVLYGVQQRRLGGTNAVLVLRNAAGDIRLCDQFGGDRPSEAPLPSATPEEPVQFLSNGRTEWSCSGTTLDRLRKSTWLTVSPDVATVRQRYLVDGEPGRWFDTAVEHGYAHLQTWITGPHPAGTTYAEEFRVLDEAGNAVQQDVLPTEPAALSGCPAEGDSAEIG
jgi:hypothetical protein